MQSFFCCYYSGEIIYNNKNFSFNLLGFHGVLRCCILNIIFLSMLTVLGSNNYDFLVSWLGSRITEWPAGQQTKLLRDVLLQE